MTRTFFVGGPRDGLALVGAPRSERVTVPAEGAPVLMEVEAGDEGACYQRRLVAARAEVFLVPGRRKRTLHLVAGDHVYEWAA